MVSVIVSTYKKENYIGLEKSISSTIGVPFEMIPIENPGLYSLSQAYNLGIKKARYPYVCFVHDDVSFNTRNWGASVVDLMLSDTKIGLVGIAGSKFKSTYPTTGWGTGPFIKSLWRGHYKTLNSQNEVCEIDLDKRGVKDEVEEMLIVDGLFLFTKKEVLEKCRFDEKMLTHFHGYDTDFSLQVFFNSYKIVIDRRLDVFHNSKGVTGPEFAKANREIRRKWGKNLPVASNDLKFGKIKLVCVDMLVWAGYLWYALQRKLKLK